LILKKGFFLHILIVAHLIDVNDRLLDRESMVEDLFWAIRGCGGASFVVMVAGSIKLVHVPSNVNCSRFSLCLLFS